MQKDLLLPPNEVPQKKAWKSWKGIVLAAFVLALVLNRWLPDILLAAFYIAGMAVILNLLFHLFRRLRNKVFWRVRHRILGSFIFVGFIPLLVLFGVAYLSIYLLLGQLSAHYLHASLDELIQEVTRINLDLGHRVVPPVSGDAFRKTAETVFGKNAPAFPKLAALLMRRKHDGSLENIGIIDPHGILYETASPAADKWLQGKTDFEGLILLKETGLLASLRPAPSVPGAYLAVLRPSTCTSKKGSSGRRTYTWHYRGWARQRSCRERMASQSARETRAPAAAKPGGRPKSAPSKSSSRPTPGG